jgi:hypothetical protein
MLYKGYLTKYLGKAANTDSGRPIFNGIFMLSECNPGGFKHIFYIDVHL